MYFLSRFESLQNGSNEGAFADSGLNIRHADNDITFEESRIFGDGMLTVLAHVLRIKCHGVIRNFPLFFFLRIEFPELHAPQSQSTHLPGSDAAGYV